MDGVILDIVPIDGGAAVDALPASIPTAPFLVIALILLLSVAIRETFGPSKDRW